MILNLPKIIGHRGVKDIAPENTILSINKAIEHNLEWIEIDVKVSKDNIPFLLHDDLLDRTTSGKGYPFKYNIEDIQPNKTKEKANVEAVGNLIQNNNFNCQYFFSSFDFLSIKLMRNFMPNSYLGYLINDFNNSNFLKILDVCLNLECFCIGFNIKLINKKILKICRDNELKIAVYSDSNIDLIQAKELWSLGVDSVFIDNPYSYFKTDYNLE